MLPPALKTGKLTIIPNAMAREVTTGADGLATGVSYVNTQKITDHHVRARVVVLAASCCEKVATVAPRPYALPSQVISATVTSTPTSGAGAAVVPTRRIPTLSWLSRKCEPPGAYTKQSV